MSIFKKENGALVEYTNPLPADYVAPIEDGATSAHDYAVGAFALVKGVLRKITTAVTSGTAITNANSEITTVAEQLEEINTDLSVKADEWEYIGAFTDGATVTGTDYEWYMLAYTDNSAYIESPSQCSKTAMAAVGAPRLRCAVDTSHYATYNINTREISTKGGSAKAVLFGHN